MLHRFFYAGVRAFARDLQIMTALRKYIIAGLLVWLPLVITVAIIKFVIDLLDGTVLLLPPEYRPEALLGFSIPGFGILLAVAILILTGMFAANLLGDGAGKNSPGAKHLQQRQTDIHHFAGLPEQVVSQGGAGRVPAQGLLVYRVSQ